MHSVLLRWPGRAKACLCRQARPLHLGFAFQRLATIELRHRGVDSFFQNRFDGVAGFIDHFRGCFQLRFLHRSKDIFSSTVELVLRTATLPTALITDFAPWWLPALPSG